MIAPIPRDDRSRAANAARRSDACCPKHHSTTAARSWHERWHFTPRAAAEAQLRRLSRIADDLLQQADGADALLTERLRAEATRLYSTCFEITAALARGNITKAYCLSVGDAMDGGVAV